ncbi:MAG: hypothetical protein JSR46_00975, partial [Verrucomicrobia bacterium]|nr:hypothetical protein [Verrucomicrobiota bacterium]
MYFWNPLHLIDGEAYWFLYFLAILTAASVATHGWRWLSLRLHEQFVAKKLYMRDAAVTAAHGPVTFYIWFLSGIKCFDLITDRFLT